MYFVGLFQRKVLEHPHFDLDLRVSNHFVRFFALGKPVIEDGSLFKDTGLALGAAAAAGLVAVPHLEGEYGEEDGPHLEEHQLGEEVGVQLAVIITSIMLYLDLI